MNSSRKNILKKLGKFVIIILIIIIAICLLLKFIEFLISRHPLSNERFGTTEEALEAYEAYVTYRLKTGKDTSLDCKPPYKYIDTIYIEDKGILIYTDGSYDLTFSFLRKTKNDKWKFIEGYASLRVDLRNKDYWGDSWRNTSSITIKNIQYTICFSYLPLNSEKEIYVDGIKSNKQIITFPNGNGENSNQVYLCYALSNKTDNFLSKLINKFDERHKYKVE